MLTAVASRRSDSGPGCSAAQQPSVKERIFDYLRSNWRDSSPHMHEFAARAQGRRVSLPGYFSFPVLIEQVSINGSMAWARVKRPDGGLVIARQPGGFKSETRNIVEEILREKNLQ